MTNLTKDELCELAQVAGYETFQTSNHTFIKSTGEEFRPDKDIKQAMECLEALEKTYDISKVRVMRTDKQMVYWCSISGITYDSCYAWTQEYTICKAVLKAMGDNNE